jgi:hypothetical protein
VLIEEYHVDGRAKMISLFFGHFKADPRNGSSIASEIEGTYRI